MRDANADRALFNELLAGWLAGLDCHSSEWAPHGKYSVVCENGEQ